MSKATRKAKEITQKLEERHGFPPPAAVINEELHKLDINKDFKYEGIQGHNRLNRACF